MILDPNAPSSITWEEVRHQLRLIKGPPVCTIATWYCYRQAIDLLEDASPYPLAVDAGVIVRIREKMERAGRRPATVRSRLSIIRAVINWLLDEGYVTRTPFRRKCQLIPKKRKRDTLKFAFRPEQVAAVLDRADYELDQAELTLQWQADRPSAKDHLYRVGRLRALTYLVAYTGLRASEALYLRCEDVKPDGTIVDVTGRDRPTKTVESVGLVPVPAEAAVVVAEWLHEQYEAGKRFLFNKLKSDGPWRESGQDYRPSSRLRQMARRAGVEGMTLLSLRHTFASCVKVYGGLNREEARQILRHTTVQTQETYTHEDIGHLARAVESFSYRRATG